MADPDRRDIAVLAQLHDCPLKRFKKRRIPLAGDILKAILRRTGIEWLYRKLRRVNPGQPCTGCEKRREAMNAVDEKVREKLGI
ncbi:MAG TPA: hypothetical protein VD994_07515 [Prosthecobacter sp.]|nr:hypothetical protein [Prosthecobacter sp.]